ncbi:MAG TPA: carbamoyltransferase HypF [Patescibacteria group bacterium]|nr:carbamoyltransferase HypF [Patescibacteria group bacterium]
MEIRKQIRVSGIVQGVGFRPYVYRLAAEHHLTGNIRNTAAGVTIEIQGPAPAVDRFIDRLPISAPELARITEIGVRDLALGPERDFEILPSRAGEAMHTLISPDVALCDDCRRELFDFSDRRYRYPFINCTNCGPRFTIVRDIPYDRPRTSMAVFPMCPACRAEYEDPSNRRFHAQPNACWDCGPRLELRDGSGNVVETDDPVVRAAEWIREGKVVAVKGLGGFHLAVDATNPEAVARLRERKHRVEKPFAVMAASLAAAERFCEIDDVARRILTSRQRPIVLLPAKCPTPIAEAVAPFNRFLGVMLPYTPLHHLLLDGGSFSALVMTSGNISEEPIAIDNEEAIRRLEDLADYFLVHNRDILLRCDDSVVRPVAGRMRQVRRSRGYVPAPVFLDQEVPPVLAVGGELKNTVCLARGNQAFLSQHVGDLENMESYGFFGEAIERLKRILEISPEVIACDLHPDYFSTKWALQQTGVRRIGVQHHHAHVAACMAENHLSSKVIGFSLDGTGYGTDGSIWGGEVLLADFSGFERAAHLAYVLLPGGAAAIREPWRMAVAYLAQHFGRKFLDYRIPLLREIDGAAIELVLRMIEQRLNSPLTSSCGRLFDAVAALAGIRHQVNYEAQAAIELEMAALGSRDPEAYPMGLAREGAGWIIETRPLFEAILRDLERRLPAGDISRRFHNGMVQTLSRLARLLRDQSGLNQVCLSGGTFQNIYLLEGLRSVLEADRFEVFTHSEVPAGDGGLSLGQAMIAAHRV